LGRGGLIAGTRVPAALILGQLAAGVAEAKLCAEYDLSRQGKSAGSCSFLRKPDYLEALRSV